MLVAYVIYVILYNREYEKKTKKKVFLTQNIKCIRFDENFTILHLLTRYLLHQNTIYFHEVNHHRHDAMATISTLVNCIRDDCTTVCIYAFYRKNIPLSDVDFLSFFSSFFVCWLCIRLMWNSIGIDVKNLFVKFWILYIALHIQPKGLRRANYGSNI